MGYYPRSDVSQDDNGLLIEMTVPGLSMTDIVLELVGNNLIVSGRNEERNQHARYFNKELYTGYFTRNYTINTKLFDVTQISSKLSNGFLVIRIPHKNTSSINKIQTINIQEEKQNGDK